MNSFKIKVKTEENRRRKKMVNSKNGLIFMFVYLLCLCVLGDPDRGMIVCSGQGNLYLEALTMLDQIRNRLNSTLKVAVMHCHELSNINQDVLTSFRDVQIINLCNKTTMNPHIEKRLKGFFCKPSALIHSPFQHAILVDTDVIWLQQPDLLFESPQYLNTGSLFFRDRWTLTTNRLTLTQGRHKADQLMTFLVHIAHKLQNKNLGSHPNLKHQRHQPLHIPEDIDYLTNRTKLIENNGYWNHFAIGQGSSLDHMQDSSVVLLNISSHPKTLQALHMMLPDFSIGYGDKEMYWLAATAANEPFAFEPHAAGSIGDCGALVHFDPRKIGQSPPFYINAEYLIDLKKINSPGDFISEIDQKLADADKTSSPETLMTRYPPMITESLPFIEGNKHAFILDQWKNMKHGFYACGNCKFVNCIPLEKSIISEITYRQKFLLGLKSLENKVKGDLTLDQYSACKIEQCS